jgi:hypothetical protein
VKNDNNAPQKVGLQKQVLVAALECCQGDLGKSFTAEELLLRVWQRDKMAWGLRGYEEVHPDSEKIYKELDRASVKGGMVGLGWLEKIRPRTYVLTPKGFAIAGQVPTAPAGAQAQAIRVLADAITDILSHPVFRAWLEDRARPRYFREAGHFWSVAPGTPPSVIRSRIRRIDETLEQALELLDARGGDSIAAGHNRVLFERQDLDRLGEFQHTLKERFASDLRALKVELTQVP